MFGGIKSPILFLNYSPISGDGVPIEKIQNCPKCGAGIHDQEVKDCGHTFTVFACWSRHWDFYAFTDREARFSQSNVCLERSQRRETNMFEKFELKIMLIHPYAVMPTRAKSGDAGMDVYTPSPLFISPRRDLLVPLGWKCEFPEGFVMLFQEKSGRATNDKLDIGACVVDSGYRGQVHAHLFNNSDNVIRIPRGEKIAQFIIVPCWGGQPIQVTELSESDRGEGGFGSTGLK